MIKICLLGATGSLGMQTLDVIRSHPERFSLISFSFKQNLDLALKIINEFKPGMVVACDDTSYAKLKSCDLRINVKDKTFLNAIATENPGDKDCVLVNCQAGISALMPTVNALKIKRKVLLANKECLVVAGNIIMDLVSKEGALLIPLDSEHSAIWQIMTAANKKEVRKIIITASGGALREVEDTRCVTPDEVLKHPTWKMGKRITVDSATLANKGLEVMEAHYLFDIDYDDIDTVLHKESIVHSLVLFNDNNLLAHLAKPDMRIFIQYALTYPERIPFTLDAALDIKEVKNLSFSAIDRKKYPFLDLAYFVGRCGGILPTVFNASDDVAVNLFLEGKIGFSDIYGIVAEEVYNYKNTESPSLEDIIRVDKEVRMNILRKYRR